MSLYIGNSKVKSNLGTSTRKIQFHMIYRPPYLTFSSPDTFSISVSTPGWNGTMEYSMDTNTWALWDGGEISGTRIHVRGKGNTQITGRPKNLTTGVTPQTWTLTGTGITCTGNIETLLDYTTAQAGDHPPMAQYCYFNMFVDCLSLTQAPDLLATTLSRNCYNGMFRNCRNLTQAPALPATTLAENCYNAMFYYCLSLTQAPALPATTLAENCYSHMFQYCRKLTQAPALPATTLAEYCYQGMFRGCTILKISETQTDDYNTPYRIPINGTGTIATYALLDMFKATGGTFTGTPSINTTYYLHSSNVIV